MNAPDPALLEFAGFTLDRSRRTLCTADGTPVPLRPRSLEVLGLLASRAGALVTRDELARMAWPDVVVTDESLSRCISDIRAALGDAGAEVVKTVPRRGYVLVADVAARWRPAPAVAPAAPSLPLPDRPSIAVLPFESLGGSPDQAYFNDGLVQDVTVRLAKFRDLFVIARDSMLSYRSRAVEPAQVARELGVRYLLGGSVRRSGERLRIVAQLVDTASQAQLWAESWDRTLTDLFAVQDELAQKIVVTLVAHITRAELDRAMRKPPGTLAAYDLYLRGMAELSVVDASPVGQYGVRLLQARHHLDLAVAEDPRYAPALTGLSDTWHRAWLVPAVGTAAAAEFRQPSTSDRALALARAAVECDPSLAEGYAQLAWVLHWRYERFEALALLQRAFELNPNLAEGRFGMVLAHAGRADEAVQWLRQVIRLDPYHRPIVLSYLANSYFLAGDDQASLDTSRIAVVRMPNVIQAHVWHAAGAACLGLGDEAAHAVAQATRLRPTLTVSEFIGSLRLARPQDVRRLTEALVKAGLPP